MVLISKISFRMGEMCVLAGALLLRGQRLEYELSLPALPQCQAEVNVLHTSMSDLYKMFGGVISVKIQMKSVSLRPN